MALLVFRKFFELFGPLLETFRCEPPMFLGRFLAPNTLYQMRPTRGQMDLIWASYGHFWFSDFRKIFEKLKSAITR
jgi:hypothetical protein